MYFVVRTAYLAQGGQKSYPDVVNLHLFVRVYKLFYYYYLSLNFNSILMNFYFYTRFTHNAVFLQLLLMHETVFSSHFSPTEHLSLEQPVKEELERDLVGGLNEPRSQDEPTRLSQLYNEPAQLEDQSNH